MTETKCPTSGGEADTFDKEDPSDPTRWMCENMHMFSGPGNPQKRVWE